MEPDRGRVPSDILRIGIVLDCAGRCDQPIVAIGYNGVTTTLAIRVASFFPFFPFTGLPELRVQ